MSDATTATRNLFSATLLTAAEKAKWVQIVNIGHRSMGFPLPYDSVEDALRLMRPNEKATKSIRFQLGRMDRSPPLPEAYANRIIALREAQEPVHAIVANPVLRKFFRIGLVPAAGSATREETLLGIKVRVCSLMGTEEDGTAQLQPVTLGSGTSMRVFPRLWHSTEQAIRYLGTLQEPEVVEQYLRVDRRPDVHTFGARYLRLVTENRRRRQVGEEQIRGRDLDNLAPSASNRMD